MSLAALVERLAADLHHHGVIEWERDGSLIEARLVVEGVLWGGAGVPLDLPVEDAAVRIVSALQDMVIEQAAGEARPPCPVAQHPHPAVLSRDTAGLGWRCPLMVPR